LKNAHGKYLGVESQQLKGVGEVSYWKVEKRKIRLAIVGAGNRGQIYARYAEENPELCEVVAVAEPRDYTRQLVAAHYRIPPHHVFTDWRELAALPQAVADAVVIATQDRAHAAPAIALADRGYHILLEKPMAVTEEECVAITEAVQRNGTVFAVGHVLRYTPYSRLVKRLLSEGAIGEVVTLQHLEPVGYWHFAHSYVRGNWRRADEASFSLMAKSCHDIDWLLWMMPRRCTKVASFGSLLHFRPANKPPSAGSRCLSCAVEPQCAYSARKIYLSRVQQGLTGWPVSVLTEQPTVASVTQALETGPYGRCVYESDNDVCDHQVVSLSFEGGPTATFTMVAFSEDQCIRKTKVFGSLGELRGDGQSQVSVFDFRTQQTTLYSAADPSLKTSLAGHGGADYYLMRTFVDAVASEDPSKILSDAQETLRSHMVVFAAEKSRLQSSVQDVSW